MLYATSGVRISHGPYAAIHQGIGQEGIVPPLSFFRKAPDSKFHHKKPVKHPLAELFWSCVHMI